MTTKAVRIPYSKLVDVSGSVDLGKEIEAAYGRYTGLGLLIIDDIPGVSDLRDKLLRLSSEFAHLPEEAKEPLVHKKSHYCVGWSHGRENLNGTPDVSKGSFYNNPIMDVPTTDESLIEQYPELCSANIWPDNVLPDYKPTFKAMGQLVVNVGKLIAKHCDKYVESKLKDKYINSIHDVIDQSNSIKARLLHYFAVEAEEKRTRDSWCGWHNDSDVLTGLVPAIYRNKEGKIVSNPDTQAGLWIRTRQDQEVKVSVGSSNALAFQIGEIAQVLTGGLLRATPHAVQAIKYPESKDIERDTFAVFMQPKVTYMIKSPKDSDLKKIEVGQYTREMTAGEFQGATLRYYYERSVEKQ